MFAYYRFLSYCLTLKVQSIVRQVKLHMSPTSNFSPIGHESWRNESHEPGWARLSPWCHGGNSRTLIYLVRISCMHRLCHLTLAFFAPCSSPCHCLQVPAPFMSRFATIVHDRGSPTFTGGTHKCAPLSTFVTLHQLVELDPARVRPPPKPMPWQDMPVTVYRSIRPHFRTFSVIPLVLDLPLILHSAFPHFALAIRLQTSPPSSTSHPLLRFGNTIHSLLSI